MPEGFCAEALRREPFAAVLGTAHPLAGRGSLGLRELRGSTFHFLPRRLAPAYHDADLAALHSPGETFTVRENPVPGLRTCTGLGSDGFMLLPRSLGERLPRSEAVCSPLTDPLPAVTLHALWHPPTAPPATAALIRTARALARSEGWTPAPGSPAAGRPGVAG